MRNGRRWHSLSSIKERGISYRRESDVAEKSRHSVTRKGLRECEDRCAVKHNREKKQRTPLPMFAYGEEECETADVDECFTDSCENIVDKTPSIHIGEVVLRNPE